MRYQDIAYERPCEHCGTIFPVKRSSLSFDRKPQRFCSVSCANLARALLPKMRVHRICQHCGIGFQVHPCVARKGEGKYCSRRCQHAAQRRPLAERLWARVDTSGTCWVWQGACCEKGYGTIGDQGHTLSTHRLVYQLTYGPIPDGYHVLHSCDTPPCVRPDHLFLGTGFDNMRDKVSKGRAYTGDHKGEQNSQHKLTAEQVRAIRAEYRAGGIGQYRLAKRYGVARENIRNIVKGKSWRHVDS